MGFFDVGVGEGGTPEDRIAIICIVAFAFCWIPIFIIWKCVTVMRRKDTDVEGGNTPVTTRNSDPKKNPYHPAPRPTKPSQSSSAGGKRRASTRDGDRRASRDGQSRPSRDIARQSSRGDGGARETINRDNTFHDAKDAQGSDTRRARASSRTAGQTSHRSHDSQHEDIPL